MIAVDAAPAAQTLTMAPDHRAMRQPGLALLRGHGLEIGALHEAAPLPAGCTVEYVDVLTRDQAAALFPEIDPSGLKEPHHLRDLDKEGLSGLADDHYDFAVLSHVIEHVADPVRVLAEVFRVLRIGGLAVIVAPDKRFTFDHARGITRFEDLLVAHERHIQDVPDERYLDFLAALYPAAIEQGGPALADALAAVRARREHAHVWDSAAFTEFLDQAMAYSHIRAEALYTCTGDENGFEHFSVWRKQAPIAL